MTLNLDTVYQVVNPTNNIANASPGFEVSGGTVDIYTSMRALDDEPADKTEMVLDRSGFGPGSLPKTVRINWVLFESASGTPVVRNIGLVRGV